MEAILDIQNQVKPELFDQVVSAFYDVSNKDHNAAHEILNKFKDLDGNWRVIAQLLDNCKNKYSKFYCLVVLEDSIKYKWLSIPEDQRTNIKNYVIQKILSIASDPNADPNDKSNISKWDIILIEILKKEWPDNWPNFIPDLANSSRSNEDLCDNNIYIFKLLLEEIYQFNTDSLTSQRSKQLQEALNKDLATIFDLCMFALTQSSRHSLILNSLEVISLLINHISAEYIFGTELVSTLLNFFTLTEYRCQVTKCLTDIFVNKGVNNYPAKFADWYTQYINTLVQHLPLENNLASIYYQCREEELYFIQMVTIFLTEVLLCHTTLLESQHKTDVILFSINYINMLARLPNVEILKQCMQYYKTLANLIYTRHSKQNTAIFVKTMSTPNEGIYKEVFHNIREILIDRMAKPEEILIVENEDGEIVREERKDSDCIALYNIMKETLVLLSLLNYDDTEYIMLAKMEQQSKLRPSDPFRNTLQPLVWAVGSISGVTTIEKEKVLLISILSDLLRICPQKVTKDDKAVVASCIMYVIQQYPNFLVRHWTFLKTVVNKNFEFMRELHPGVQDMACDTFNKVVRKCYKEFLKEQLVKENILEPPYIIDIIRNTPTYTINLNPQQQESYYRSIGIVIRAERNTETQQQYLSTLITPFNQKWQAYMQQAASNIMSLVVPDTIKDLRFIIQINTVLVETMGDAYTVQLGVLFNDIVGLYKYYNEFIANYIHENGESAANHYTIRYIIADVRSILKYFTMFIEKSKNRDEMTTQKIIQFIEVALLCYNNIPNCAKIPEVLSFLSCIVTKLQNGINSLIPNILDAVYGGTLSLISQDQINYPEIRLEFYNLLSCLAQYSFEKLFSFGVAQQQVLIDSILWGFKHDSREICETSLQTMIKVLMNAKQASADFKQPFYSHFLIKILTETFYVLTDRMHVSTFQSQCLLLQLLFKIILSGEVTVELSPGTPNNQSVFNYLYQLLVTAFPNMNPAHITTFFEQINAKYNASENDFRTLVRDFLIQLKEFSVIQGELYQAEKEQKKLEEQQAEYERKKNIPGMLGPNYLDDELF